VVEAVTNVASPMMPGHSSDKPEGDQR
jgi:hypothetical protein